LADGLEPFQQMQIQRVVRIEQHTHAGKLRDHRAHEIEVFQDRVVEPFRCARDVAAWVRQIRDQTATERIADAREHDRNGLGRVHRLESTSRVECNDEVHGHAHELGGEVGEALIVALGITPLDDKITSLHVVKLSQALEESSMRAGLHRGRPGPAAERADALDLGLRERVQRQPGRVQTQGQGQQESPARNHASLPPQMAITVIFCDKGILREARGRVNGRGAGCSPVATLQVFL
jgi:hypothetical protein